MGPSSENDYACLGHSETQIKEMTSLGLSLGLPKMGASEGSPIT